MMNMKILWPLIKISSLSQARKSMWSTMPQCTVWVCCKVSDFVWLFVFYIILFGLCVCIYIFVWTSSRVTSIAHYNYNYCIPSCSQKLHWIYQWWKIAQNPIKIAIKFNFVLYIWKWKITISVYCTTWLLIIIIHVIYCCWW